MSYVQHGITPVIMSIMHCIYLFNSYLLSIYFSQALGKEDARVYEMDLVTGTHSPVKEANY